MSNGNLQEQSLTREILINRWVHKGDSQLTLRALLVQMSFVTNMRLDRIRRRLHLYAIRLANPLWPLSLLISKPHPFSPITLELPFISLPDSRSHHIKYSSMVSSGSWEAANHFLPAKCPFPWDDFFLIKGSCPLPQLDADQHFQLQQLFSQLLKSPIYWKVEAEQEIKGPKGSSVSATLNQPILTPPEAFSSIPKRESSSETQLSQQFQLGLGGGGQQWLRALEGQMWGIP